MDSNTQGMVILIVGFIVCLVIYFLPALIAQRNDHPSYTAILALNLLAGWTFIGWIIAIVWALNRPKIVPPAVPTNHDQNHRPCPFCAEPIMAIAIKCKHCGSDLLSHPADFVGR